MILYDYKILYGILNGTKFFRERSWYNEKFNTSESRKRC